MIQQLTSPSTYSVDSNALRLNSSSMASQSNFDSGLKQIINFEEFTHEGQQGNSLQLSLKKIPAGKKKLTIKIDESYQCSQQQEELQEKLGIAFQKSGEKFHESITTPMSEFELVSPIEDGQSQNLYKLVKQMQVMQEKLSAKDKIIEQLTLKLSEERTLNECINKHTKQLQATCSEQQEQIVRLSSSLKQSQQTMQRLQSQKEAVEERKKEYMTKMKDMVKLNKMYQEINRGLNEDIKKSENKVKELEKETQKNLCIATQENINKLKESSLKLRESRNSYHNKENSTNNCGSRKSLERKKTGPHACSTGHIQNPKKTQRVASSTTMMLNRKLWQK